MDKLVKQRASCKSSITKLFTWVEANLNTEKDKYAFKFRLDNLEATYIKYCSIQDLIEADSDDVEVASEDRTFVENRYFSLKCKLQNAFDGLDNLNSPVNDNHVSNVSTVNNNVKLPSIDIPVFSGNYTEYNTFIDLFTALIVNNTRLSSKSEKFYYLKSFLRGEPLKLIEKLQVNEQNFDTALNLLKSRYQNKRQIVTAHFNNIVNFPTMNKCNAVGLRQFAADAKSSIDSLSNLNIPKEQLFDALLTHILKNKLDFQTKRALEECQNSPELITQDSFFDFMDKRCNILENLSVQDQKSDQPKSFVRSHTSNSSVPLNNRVSLLSQENLSFNQAPGDRSMSPQTRVSSNVYSAQSSTPNATPLCSYCKNSSHKIYSCSKFGSLSVADRHKFVKSNHMCFGCLGSKHLLPNCTSMGTCSICRLKHHVLLHLPTNTPKRNVALNSISRPTSNSAQASQNEYFTPNSPYRNVNSREHFGNVTICQTPTSSYSQPLSQPLGQTAAPLSPTQLAALNLNGSHVLLATAKVQLYPRRGLPVIARALLDPGSQNSFICSSLVNKLQSVTYDQSLQVSGIFDSSRNINSMTDITFYSLIDRSVSFETTCAVVEKITQQLPQVNVDFKSLLLPPHFVQCLADPDFCIPSQVDLLLGADIYYSLLKPAIHSLGKNRPTLLDTHLGWVISGVVPPQSVRNRSVTPTLSHSFLVVSGGAPEELHVESLLERFWSQEELLPEEKISEEDRQAEAIFTSTTRVLSSGRFQVDLPLVHEKAHKGLGDSFVAAKHRFMSLEKRLAKDPTLHKEYKKLLLEYIQLGHGNMVPLSLQNSFHEHNYFVPHLCVIKDHSSSTKVRIVFDYSSKTSSQISLNDISLKGPRVQPELLDILVRFRNFKYALTADIQKMYRQIALNPKFHFLQNVLWRDSPSDDFSCIQLSTVSFGQKSAPYLACRVLKEIALRNPHYPDVQAALLSQTYVDDVLSGANTLHDLENLYLSLTQVLYASGLTLHKFCSNSSDITTKYFVNSPAGKDLNLEEDPCKVLGISWNPQSDIFQISSPSEAVTHALTKRKILSTISQCFDPLGLVNPVIVQGKLIMQQLWLLKISWDELVTDSSLIKNWQTFVDSISRLPQLQIPRYTLLNKTFVRLELHGFCDASSVAYGGCIYLRAIYEDNTASSQLLISKSRVAPLKTSLTIPKLELCAMTLLAKLHSRVVGILEHQLDISTSVLWSDSQIALSWVKGTPSRWAVFINNRVVQIQKLTPLASWRHIRSQLNPADILSRGKPLDTQSVFWFSGPEFLWNSSQDTGQYDTFSVIENPPEERKKTLAALSTPSNPWVTFISRFSSFNKLVKSMAYVFRFIDNIKTKNKCKTPLSTDELDRSLVFLVQQVQKCHFSSLINTIKLNKIPSDKKFASLTLFLDQDQLLRVGGRLKYADVSFQQKHPILLPSRNHFSSLLLKREHLRLGHSGPQNVLYNVRLQFWPLDGLREVKRIIHQCIVCHRFKAITAQQLMADLPKLRVSPSRPFQYVGIDFGGPFCIKASRLRKAPVVKCYLALFVCLSSKAVHLELVSDLSTEAFLATLKRFSSRRGLPSTIYSDNGTNFVGASNHLKELSTFFKNNSSVINDYLLASAVEWKFIPPRSPHWGGIWESAIKSSKQHLFRMLQHSCYTFEQFSTILSQIEAILNSRPLFPLSSDPLDLQPLTPGHFLVGAPLMALPEKDISFQSVNRLKFWQHCTFVQQHFWKRWTVDYLNQLQHRPKWTSPCQDLKVNDMVLVKDDESPPLKWPLARIVAIMPGKDGRVRSVQIRTSSGIYTRPIVKIVPLPINDLPYPTPTPEE